ncbi:MAG: polysaccharide biosynthesis C-terminal domain-containing protein [Thermoleophilaceae bacterium]|nr:polysaccharide biosynthesis C-terminal domain-containing protein [Thermoleophilaceae bacterium]
MSNNPHLGASPGSDLLDTPDAGPVAVRGGTVRVAGYAVGVLLTVGSAALLFRHLGVVDTGRYLTVLALTSIVAGITDVGLTTIGLRELAVRDESEKRLLIRDLLGLRLVLSVVGVAVAGAFALAVGYDAQMVTGTLLAGVGVVAVALQATLSVALMVELRLGWVAILDLIRQALLVAGILALVAAGAGILPFLALQGPTAVAALALTAWLVHLSVPLTPAFHPDRWRALLREVLPFAAATIVAAVYFRAALIVLGLVSTDVQTGYFGAAFRISEVLLMVPNIVVGAAFPIFARAARDDHDRLGYGVDRVFQASLVLGGMVLVALTLGAPFAIEVVAGSQFEPSEDVLRIQAVALMASFVTTTLFYALLSLRMHRSILAVVVVLLAANVTLAWILGAAHGATGAAYATLASEVVGLVAAWVILRRSHPGVAPRLSMVPRVALAVAAGGLVALVPGLPSVVAAVIGTAVYSVAVLVLRAVPEELLQALGRRAEAPA